MGGAHACARVHHAERRRQAEGLAAVEAARAAEDAQVKETGEAQRATVTRDAAARAVRIHAAELAAVARVALADQPQLREPLGLLER